MYYSQGGEDKYLNDHIFKSKTKGVYVELGALDGNVIDTVMAKAMSVSLRWGNSCGTPFDKNKFCYNIIKN